MAGCPQSSPAGVKLEAMMEQLQRQQEEKHLLQAQLLFAQQAAAAAAARASGSRADGAIFQAAQQHLSRVDLKVEDSDQEVEEMLEPEEGGDGVDDDDEERRDENGPPFQAKKLDVHQVPRFQPFPMSLPAAEPESPQMKQEQEEKSLSSPAGQTTFTSPNGFPDWSYDELFRQVRSVAVCEL